MTYTSICVINFTIIQEIDLGTLRLTYPDLFEEFFQGRSIQKV